MIIKKKEFAYSKKTRQQWPFTVSEITVVAVNLTGGEKPQYAFAIVHNWGTYALSGALESHGFESLDKSGIWKSEVVTNKDGEHEFSRRPLTPFFDYVNKRIKGVK